MSEPDFGAFRIQLQRTLYNLYNPLFEPERCVFEVVGCLPASGLESARARIVSAIEEMGMGEGLPDGLPSSSRSRVDRDLLHYRFVKLHSQEQTSELMGISVRHLRRKQQEAVTALALRLWKKRYPAERINGPGRGLTDDATTSAVAEILSFKPAVLLKEIEILNAGAPGSVANLLRTVHKAASMARQLSGGHYPIGALDIPEELEVALHPTVLRQVILYVFECIWRGAHLSDQISIQRGETAIAARLQADVVSIVFSVGRGQAPTLLPQVHELISALGGEIGIRTEQDTCSLELRLPKAARMRVLVVDDNLELMGLYRRFVANTQYDIIPLPGALPNVAALLEHVETIQPDIIVIDILLPGIDGWELLLRIRQEYPELAIPIVIISAVGDENLAASLGASGCLAKPVERRDFIRMLDRVYKAS